MTEEMKSAIPSKDDISCPNCGRYGSELTEIARSDPDFHEEPEPHYKWVEWHRCSSCKTVYSLNNGS